ncbi:MAG: AbrB/MazE/SpoVT family DNA-binding domain-containing protein [Cyanobacteria bacterium SZAS LIN-3]|nr:AbrB/MazE/SpoVT family DNA-binding domain-containing protein [Cyanobacteria bacterium SZAS LIN-3]
MIKKLTKHGNSQALVLDRAVLDLLKISSDTELEITTDGKRLLIEPIRKNTAELSGDTHIDYGARV